MLLYNHRPKRRGAPVADPEAEAEAGVELEMQDMRKEDTHTPSAAGEDSPDLMRPTSSGVRWRHGAKRNRIATNMGHITGFTADDADADVVSAARASTPPRTAVRDGVGDWVESVDKTNGRTYYYNKRTRETSWTAPPEAQTDVDARQQASTVQQASAAGAPDAPPVASAQRTSNTPPRLRAAVRTVVLAGGGLSSGAEWAERVDERTGRAYFFNRRTRTSSWVRPAALELQSP